MRVQLNKTGLDWENCDYSKHYFIDIYSIVSYCPNCGTEFFSVWKVPYDTLGFDRRGQIGRTTARQFRTIDSKVKEEMTSMSENAHVCPVCQNNECLIYKYCGSRADKENDIIFANVFPIRDVSHYSTIFAVRACEEKIPSVSPNDTDMDSYMSELVEKDLDGCFEALRKKEKAQRQPAIEQAVRTISKQYDVPVIAQSNVNVTAIKNDPEKLKTFIFNLIQLETNILSLEKWLTTLYSYKSENECALRFAEIYPIYIYSKEHSKLEQAHRASEQSYRESLEHLSACEKNKPKPAVLSKPEKPAEPEYETPSLFNKKKVLARNEALKIQYLSAVAQYEQDLYEYNTRTEELLHECEKQYQISIHKAQEKVEQAKIARDQAGEKLNNLKMIPSVAGNEKIYQQYVDQEIEKAGELLKKTYAARNELYAHDIVFKKYRDMVALSTFYEYLMAGRCTSLEGAYGAYNLYETEVRAEIIISRLTDILSTLQKIENTQRMVYTQLTQMNNTLQRMDKTMRLAYCVLTEIHTDTQDMKTNVERITENSDVIAHNTAVTAYYSKLNAELTDALGYMVAMK